MQVSAAPSVTRRDHKKATMQDIAVTAKVSIGTVSRVLGGKPDVSSELVERVMRTAQAMGYGARNAEKRNAKRNRDFGSIGFIVDSDLATAASPFQQHFLSGIEQTVTESGGHLVFSACRSEIAKNAIPPMIVDNLVNGVILKAAPETPLAWIQKISHLTPVVLLMHRDMALPLPSVMCDNRSAVYQCLRYLKELGHTKIGFFFEDEENPRRASLHHVERLEAFLKYAPLLGLTVRPEYVQTPRRDAQKGEDLGAVAQRALKDFLALGDQRPTAIICAADVFALSILRVARDLGIEIPRDLSLIGVMNDHSCEVSMPTLTSVSLSEEEVGRAAVDLLKDRIERPFATVRHVTVGAHLVERGSCARLPA